jgi:hypothetical protein
MPSVNRDIAKILGRTEAANTDNVALGSGSGLTVYATPSLLPTSGFTAGDQAFVTSNKKLYISTATGWYAVATANLAPVITDNGLDTELVTGGSNVDVVLSATDPEGLPLTWTYEVTSGSIGGTTVSQVDNVFTFTPSSNVADEGIFNVTFTADDGINTSNVVKTFNLSNDPPVIGSYTSSYDFATDGTPIILTLTATDPEGQDITWSYNVTSGSLGSTATVSQADNVFTITPSTNSSNGGEFTLTFTASDGTNSDTAAIAFSLSFGPTETKIQSSDIQASDEFGYSVAISNDGNYAIVGAWKEDAMGIDAGAAYIYVRSGSTWTQQAKIVANAATGANSAGGLFGHSVAIDIDGDTVIVGSPGADSSLGAAYVFTRSGSTWTQQQKLTHLISGYNVNAQAGDQFGWSVSMSHSGTRAVIGARTADVSFADDGSAFVFSLSSGTWSPEWRLSNTDREAGDYFGHSVAIDGNGSYAIVGAILEDTGGSNAGAAYIFTRSGTSWSQQAKIQSSDIQAGDRFGQGVSINQDGTYAIIGAGEEDGGAGDPISAAGAAYVFTRSGSTWTQQAKLTASDAQASDKFGGNLGAQSVTISSTASHVIIGAQYEDTPGSNAGAAYIFSRSGSTWTEEYKLQSSDIQAGDYFGWSASINSNGTYYIIGGPREATGGTRAGAAYIYEAD